MPLLLTKEPLESIQCDAMIIGQDCSSPLVKGNVNITESIDLPCKYVIYTLLPTWQGGGHGEHQSLAKSYRTALMLAEEKQCECVTLPLITPDGYPTTQVMRIMTDVIRGFLEDFDMTIYLVVSDSRAFEISDALRGDVRYFMRDVCGHSGYDKRVVNEGYMLPVKEAYTLEKKACREAVTTLSGGKNGGSPLTTAQIRDRMKQFAKYNQMASSFAQMSKSFTETLFDFMNERKLTAKECYTCANLGKQLFSKIRVKHELGQEYLPSKITALSFAFGLRLSLPDTQKLLMSAGLYLSRSIVYDCLIMFFIMEGGARDVYDVNNFLFTLNEDLDTSFELLGTKSKLGDE